MNRAKIFLTKYPINGICPAIEHKLYLSVSRFKKYSE